MINAKIIKDSINKQGDRITTMKLTFPRFILAELNTHRMFSKNSASSRAIPFEKMVKSVQENPFIPIAWQKDHKGMQGIEYVNIAVANDMRDQWLNARDVAINKAKILSQYGLTKQLCNRLLEPFMWHTVLITATEWENFFALRCPKYSLFSENLPLEFRSKKDLLKYTYKVEAPEFQNQYDDLTEIDWLQCNKGQAEIHMMALAEAMWDAYNESTPQLLQPGEWHIPYEDSINTTDLINKLELDYQPYDDGSNDVTNAKIKASTAMCARESYTTIGDEKEFTIEKQIALHDKLIKSDPKHWSPTEHCARAMTNDEYKTYIKGKSTPLVNDDSLYIHKDESKGWCRNYKGFIQYRELLDTGI